MVSCDVGDVVTLQTIFANRSGSAVDPTTVTLYLRLPDATVGTYTYASGSVLRTAAGTYTYAGTITEPGYYNARWVGAGTALAAEQSRFFARSINT